MSRSASVIEADIVDRLGFFPPFFEPARSHAPILENLWQQTSTAYLDSPLPALFKDRLSVMLAGYCSVPQSLICHNASLRPPEEPVPGFAEIATKVQTVGEGPLKRWPEPGSAAEEAVLSSSLSVFLHQDSARCLELLRQLLPEQDYDYLTLFLGYSRTCLHWAEAHPELGSEPDTRKTETSKEMLIEEPRVAEFFSDAPSPVADQYWLDEQNRLLLETERQASARLRLVLDGVCAFVAILDGQGNLIEVNDLALLSVKHTREDEVNRPFWECQWWTEMPTEAAAIRTAVECALDGEAASFDVRYRKASGAFGWYSLFIRLLPFHSGPSSSLIVSGSEITQSKEVEEYLQITLDCIGDAVIRTEAGANPTVDFLNPVAEQLTGWTLAEARGRGIAEIFQIHSQTDRQPMEQPVERVIREGKALALNNSTLLRARNGTEYHIENTASPIWADTGAMRGVVLVFRDVTWQYEVEQELRLAKRAAESANEAKSAFLANMSHEIRTPLSVIMGFTSLLNQSGLEASDIAEFAAIIDRNSSSLTRIVDDILDLSKVEAGKMIIELIPFSPCELLADLTSLMGSRAREKGIEFRAQDDGLPGQLLGDPNRLRQILMNAVGNAIKFTEKGQVNLQTRLHNGMLEFRIDDTGVGISEKERTSLFHAFGQADSSTSRKFGGTGLGLVLTRGLCETMGGSYTLLKSGVGEGSSFLARVPIETIPETVAPLDSNPLLSLAGLKILVVDDSPDNQAFHKIILTRAGAQVTTADNGQDCLDRAEKQAFSVILMDLQMPNLDGHEATASLRGRGYTGPIIALTAHAMAEEKERCQAAGFTDYLSKPVDVKTLLQRIVAYAHTN